MTEHEGLGKTRGLIVRCDRCNRQLIVPGAIVLSPPDQEGNVRKRHLCLSCWYDVRGTITCRSVFSPDHSSMLARMLKFANMMLIFAAAGQV